MRRLAIAFLLTVPAWAQTRMTLEQLRSFLKSSVDLHQPDKQVADFLKKSKLTQKLEARYFEEFTGMNVGPKTVEILREMVTTTKDLPAPPPPAAAAAKPLPPAIPPPSSEQQAEILEKAREYALGYSKRLPDFICMQVTRRYVDPSGLEFWRNADTITTRLSYFDQKEDYKVITINGRMSDVAYQKLDGATSSGEFGTMMRELFEPQTAARFEWQRWGTLRGKRNHVYSYFVAQPNSKWTVSYERRDTTTPGYRGLVYIDRDTMEVSRITLEADLPPSFPIQLANTILDYDSTDISGSRFMLPLRAEVRMRAGKDLVKNEVEFRMYRKFGADSSIKFDTPEPLPSDAVTEQPPK
ncbi:MAG TPA: hypothetical protein VFQ91_19925 [Bryobacteraceae bacterium]|nr:hypothetical protein [Bryobacteraceae bacterium]